MPHLGQARRGRSADQPLKTSAAGRSHRSAISSAPRADFTRRRRISFNRTGNPVLFFALHLLCFIAGSTDSASLRGGKTAKRRFCRRGNLHHQVTEQKPSRAEGVIFHFPCFVHFYILELVIIQPSYKLTVPIFGFIMINRFSYKSFLDSKQQDIPIFFDPYPIL